MSAVVVAILTFLSSSAGSALIAQIFHKAVKSTSRQAQILAYADSAFLVLEALGPQLGLSSQDKYLKFIETIVNALKAAGQPDLTASEVAMLKGLAERKSLITKTSASVH